MPSPAEKLAIGTLEHAAERIEGLTVERDQALSERDRLREAGNRLAVVADDWQDELLEAVGSVDGWKVVEDWWKAVEALDSEREGMPAALDELVGALREIRDDTDHPSWQKYKAIAAAALRPHREEGEKDD